MPLTRIAAAQRLVDAHPSLAHLGPLLTPQAFVDNGYIGLGVPIGTDALIQDFVVKKCKNIMEDVDKLDNIQDCFIHYQLLRFCQATRLQYLNGQFSSRTSRFSSNSTSTTRSPTPC